MGSVRRERSIIDNNKKYGLYAVNIDYKSYQHLVRTKVNKDLGGFFVEALIERFEEISANIKMKKPRKQGSKEAALSFLFGFLYTQGVFPFLTFIAFLYFFYRTFRLGFFKSEKRDFYDDVIPYYYLDDRVWASILLNNNMLLLDANYKVLESPEVILFVDEAENKLHKVVFSKTSQLNVNAKIPKLIDTLQPYAGEVIDTIEDLDAISFVFKTVSNTEPSDIALRISEETNSLYLDGYKSWDIDSVFHGLIVGSTGSGKTMFMQYLINFALMVKRSSVYVIDIKNIDFGYFSKVEIERQFEKNPEFVNKIYGSDSSSAFSILRSIESQLNFRKKILSELDVTVYTETNLKPIFLFIDEISALQAVFNDTKQKNDFVRRLKAIILQARAVGIYVVVGTQQANADVLPTEIRDQIGFKVALGRNSAEGLRMIFGTQSDFNYASKGTAEGYYKLDGMNLPVSFNVPFISKDISFNNYSELKQQTNFDGYYSDEFIEKLLSNDNFADKFIKDVDVREKYAAYLN